MAEELSKGLDMLTSGENVYVRSSLVMAAF